MNPATAGLLQIALLLVALALSYRPLGSYLARVYDSPVHNRAERVVYRICGVDPEAQQRWTGYATGVLCLFGVSAFLLYALQRAQGVLPGGQGRPAVPPDTAFTTAIGYATNTDWQSQPPEVTTGNTLLLAGLTVQNFLSAAVGVAVAVALVRGLARERTDRIGNVWVDVTRGVVRVFLPLAFLGAVVLLVGGVVMSFAGPVVVTALDGAQHRVPLAPVAAIESVKLLGSNGGGLYGANSAHPFENPSALTSLVQVYLMLLVPVALLRTFGVMVGDHRQSRPLVSVVAVVAAAVLCLVWAVESRVPRGAAQVAGAALEGRESRFGVFGSALFAVAATGTSTGAENAAHNTFGGLAVAGLLVNMVLGEIAPGGVGNGLHALLVVALLAVFLASLMVGRTPEYLGKKIGRVELSAVSVAVLTMPLLVLTGTAAALALPTTRDALAEDGPAGVTAVLYTYASAANNNGGAFGGLDVGGGYVQVTVGLVMAFGRFLPALAVLRLAGAFAEQGRSPVTAGTLPTTGPLFGALLAGVAVLVAALTFLPALALGPLAGALG
ncbi:potassium-transporting ATPase subunit A [Actinoalloteichus sp. AHMU CJ021]|uniref:potassium-transporting ATPase subunit KdpA n=1 Tax=Actinoalloteichus sp. AHMU CJ021 TaxID=2072503 RepID=UPI000CA012E2|nr:potassium-transporting ATPase subunit A [Actinoalloteichus sp. AHMU CJ021]